MSRPSERSTTLHACTRDDLAVGGRHRSANVTTILRSLRRRRVAHLPATKTPARGPPRGMRHARVPTNDGKIEKRLLFVLAASWIARRSDTLKAACEPVASALDATTA